MTEAERTTLFLKWSKARLNQTFAFEAKIARGGSLPFDAVKDHQANALFYAKHGIMNHKIADGASGGQLPFDGFQLYHTPAYVVIFWYEKPGDKRMTLIGIDEWLNEKGKSARKSLTYERSCEIGRCEGL